jgi:hypothetical protein
VKKFEPMKDGCLLCSTMFVRTAALQAAGGFRQAYYPADDWDLELRLSQAGTVLVLREAVAAYRFHTGANTYRLFAEMQEKRRWAEDSYMRRMQSAPELTLERFRLAQPNDFWLRLRHYRKDSSRLHMRTAGQRYLDGRYIAGAGHLIVSAVLHPAELIARIRRYFRRS